MASKETIMTCDKQMLTTNHLAKIFMLLLSNTYYIVIKIVFDWLWVQF